MLALRVALEAQKDFEAVVFQTCGQRNVETIVGELADTLKGQLGQDISQLPPDQKLREVKEWLKRRHTLLVLDDVWLDSDGSPGKLKFQDLIPDPSVSILFTSRRPNLPGVTADRKWQLDAFTTKDVDELVCEYLGEATLQRRR